MIVCGIAHFGRRSLETTQTDKIWSKILFPMVWTRGATWGLDSRHYYPFKVPMFVSSHFIEVIVIIIAQSPFHTGIMSCLNLATMVPGTIEVFIALNQGAGVCVVATLLFRILRVATVALTISVFKLFFNHLHWFTLRLAPGEPNWRTKAKESMKNLIAEV